MQRFSLLPCVPNPFFFLPSLCPKVPAPLGPCAGPSLTDLLHLLELTSDSVASSDLGEYSEALSNSQSAHTAAESVMRAWTKESYFARRKRFDSHLIGVS